MGDDCNRMSFQLISMLRVLIDHAEAQSKGRKEIMKSIDNISTELKHSNDSIKTELMNLNKSIASLTSSIDNLRQVLISQRASSNEALSHHQIQPLLKIYLLPIHSILRRPKQKYHLLLLME